MALLELACQCLVLARLGLAMHGEPHKQYAETLNGVLLRSTRPRLANLK